MVYLIFFLRSGVYDLYSLSLNFLLSCYKGDAAQAQKVKGKLPKELRGTLRSKNGKLSLGILFDLWHTVYI